MPSRGRLIGPVTISSTEASVRNRQGTWKVSTPWPKWLTAGATVPGSGVTCTASSPSPPLHCALKPVWHSSSQPWPLAMSSGRQR